MSTFRKENNLFDDFYPVSKADPAIYAVTSQHGLDNAVLHYFMTGVAGCPGHYELMRYAELAKHALPTSYPVILALTHSPDIQSIDDVVILPVPTSRLMSDPSLRRQWENLNKFGTTLTTPAALSNSVSLCMPLTPTTFVVYSSEDAEHAQLIYRETHNLSPDELIFGDTCSDYPQLMTFAHVSDVDVPYYSFSKLPLGQPPASVPAETTQPTAEELLEALRVASHSRTGVSVIRSDKQYEAMMYHTRIPAAPTFNEAVKNLHNHLLVTGKL